MIFGHALVLEGEFVRVVDCDIYASGNRQFSFRTQYGQISDSRFEGGGSYPVDKVPDNYVRRFYSGLFEQTDSEQEDP